METEIPQKLLDLPTVDTYDVWPVEEGFHYLGYALRIDYSTRIHREDGEWESFFHHFTSGVRVYEPTESGDVFALSTRGGMIEPERDQTYYLSPAVDPIVFGIVDRFVFLTPENRTLILAHPDVGLSPEDAVEDLYFVASLPNCALAWDPEGKQLLICSLKGDPMLVLRGGNLGITDSAMIIG